MKSLKMANIKESAGEARIIYFIQTSLKYSLENDPFGKALCFSWQMLRGTLWNTGKNT